ncbi:hypothetical protein ACIPC1_21940 [Streptomyces sp. NPDC087263]|uniref:hypothetical protein n=1 Tax=Streptomyces sp. NPDC087263 TaxID=3365773 RepID=UPI00380D10D3
MAEASYGSQVAGAVSPFRAKAVSEDASTAYSTVTCKARAGDLTDAAKNTLRAVVRKVLDAIRTVASGDTLRPRRPRASSSLAS